MAKNMISHAIVFTLGISSGYLLSTNATNNKPAPKPQQVIAAKAATYLPTNTPNIHSSHLNTAASPSRCHNSSQVNSNTIAQCLQAWRNQGGQHFAIKTLTEYLNNPSSTWAQNNISKAFLAEMLLSAGEEYQAAFWLLSYAQEESDIDKSERALLKVSQILQQWWQNNDQSSAVFTDIAEQYLQQKPDDSDIHWWLAQLAMNQNQPNIARYHALLARTAPQLQADADALIAIIDTPLGTSKLTIPLNKATNQYLLKGTIEGEPMTFLVDTGASISAISYDFAHRYLQQSFTGKKLRLQTAGGQYHSDLLKVDNIYLGNDQLHINDSNLAVLSKNANSNFDALLGLDIMANFHFSVNAEDRSLQIELP